MAACFRLPRAAAKRKAPNNTIQPPLLANALDTVPVRAPTRRKAPKSPKLSPNSNPIKAAPYAVALQYGQQVLFDKTQTLSNEVHPIRPALPDESTFTSHIQHFWLEALRAAKLIRRSDLWRAKVSVDGALKQYMLTMMEWHTLSIDPTRNIWHDGRFLAEWLDRDVQSALPATFAAFDPIDLWRALTNTIDLFRHLSQDSASRLGLKYPSDLEQQASGWLAVIEKSAEVD